MKSRLVVSEHTVFNDAQVVEVWDGDQFVAAVYGREGTPGVRVISKFPIEVIQGTDGTVNVTEVIIG